MYRNRGKLPNINNEDKKSDGYTAPHYSRYWTGRFIIIKYDKTFVAIELISAAIILLTVLAVYIFAYKVTFEDPIASIKNNFLTAQLIAIILSIVATLLVSFFTRSEKENLIRNLRIVAILSMLTIIIFIGVKINIDNKYNKNTFEEFYEQYEKSNSTNSDKFSIGLSGMKIASEKEIYVDNSINAYTNFSVKTMLYMIIHVCLVIIVLYLSHRLSYIQKKREILNKDDIVVYDDEENVKF